MHRKTRTDTPSLGVLHESIELDPADRRVGTWTRLELIRMDQRFCAAMGGSTPAQSSTVSRRIRSGASGREVGRRCLHAWHFKVTRGRRPSDPA